MWKVLLLCVLAVAPLAARAAPPYSGTIFLEPEVIRAEDPTAFTALLDLGTGSRTMYDRRVGWVTLEVFLFEAHFSDGPPVEVQVNPEFGSVEAARAQAAYYLPVMLGVLSVPGLWAMRRESRWLRAYVARGGK